MLSFDDHFTYYRCVMMKKVKLICIFFISSVLITLKITVTFCVKASCRVAEQVLPDCSSAAFTDTPASLGGAETGGRSLGGGGGGTGGREKGRGRVRVERRGVVKEVEGSTLGLRLQRRGADSLATCRRKGKTVL